MARSLYRSGKAFMIGALGELSPDSETPIVDIRAAVAQEVAENEAVNKTLYVMERMGHVVRTGEGDNATYRLTESGGELLAALGDNS